MSFDQNVAIYGLYLGLFGIVITVVLSIWSGTRKSKRLVVKQRQDVGSDGKGIQVGGNVTVNNNSLDKGGER